MDSAATSLFAEHPCLFLDASGLTIRVGLWQGSRWLAYREDPAPALASLFTSTRAVLAEASLSFPQIGGFSFVEGPGAVLGLRLAALAIRTWQADTPGRNLPTLTCGSLHLAATLALAGGAQPPFAVATDARQGRWHLLHVESSAPAVLAMLSSREITAGELAQLPSPLYYFPARKTWQPPPRPHSTLPASLRNHPALLATPGLFHPTPTATPFAGAAPEYKKWQGTPA
jgi:tRNA threonylcarbamoyladenosine biosynthesis protein TsaB